MTLILDVLRNLNAKMLNSRKSGLNINPEWMQCKSTVKFRCQFSNECPGVILSVPQETSGCKCFKNNFFVQILSSELKILKVR